MTERKNNDPSLAVELFLEAERTRIEEGKRKINPKYKNDVPFRFKLRSPLCDI